MKSMVMIELDLESAMVDLESTQVRIGPGFSSIFSFFNVNNWVEEQSNVNKKKLSIKLLRRTLLDF